MEEQEISKFGLIQCRYLFCLLLSNFFHDVITSSTAPLYPPQATARGLNSSTLGLVTSVFLSALIVSTFLFGTQIEKFGLKRIYVSCILIIGTASILFGLITYVESANVFLVLSFLLRGLEGIGVGGKMCTIYMLPPILFPGYVSPIFGAIHTTFAVSSTVGPLLGTLADSSYGFTFTYVLFGLLELVAGVLVAITIPNKAAPESVRLGTKKLLMGYSVLLKLTSVLVFVYACAVAGAVHGGINAVLQPTLAEYGLSEVSTGWTFFLTAVPQFPAPLWGFLIDRMDRPLLTVVAGAVSTVIACIVLGPFPGIPSSFPLLVAGLLLLGFAQGLLTVACLCNFRLQIIRQSGSENMLHMGFFSIGYGVSNAVGAMASSFVSGLLYNSFGLPCTILFPIAINIILVILVMYQINYSGIESSPHSTSVETAEEKDPLLSGS